MTAEPWCPDPEAFVRAIPPYDLDIDDEDGPDEEDE